MALVVGVAATNSFLALPKKKKEASRSSLMRSRELVLLVRLRSFPKQLQDVLALQSTKIFVDNAESELW